MSIHFECKKNNIPRQLQYIYIVTFCHCWRQRSSTLRSGKSLLQIGLSRSSVNMKRISAVLTWGLDSRSRIHYPHHSVISAQDSSEKKKPSQPSPSLPSGGIKEIMRKYDDHNASECQPKRKKVSITNSLLQDRHTSDIYNLSTSATVRFVELDLKSIHCWTLSR